jgi:hypothetical protein
MTLRIRVLAASAILAIAVPLIAPAQTQTPITVEVINDTDLPDSDVFLMVVGQDVGNAPAGSPATYFPFLVNGVSGMPAGLVTSSTTALSTSAGSIKAADAPMVVTASASPILMAFSPATIAATTGVSTLTITLPDSGAIPASVLVQPFVVNMPPGVAIDTSSLGGTCEDTSDVGVTSTQIQFEAGLAVPQGGCTITVNVSSSTLGAVSAWTSYLQTGGNAPPTAAALNVVPQTAGLVAVAFSPATIAVGTGNNATLTITIPSAAAQTTLTAPFVSTLPQAIQAVAPYTYTNTCAAQTVAVTARQVTLPTGTVIPVSGCTITVTVTSIATAGALARLSHSGATIPSPYTGQQRKVYTFTMSTVSSGSLFVSYYQPVTYPSAPTVRTGYRFQPLEFSYSNGIASNGDLTSIDFYGIPLELETFKASDTAQQNPLDRVSYYTSTSKLMREFQAVDPNLQYAFIGTDGKTFVPAYGSNGNVSNISSFARIVGPNQVAAGGTPALIDYPTLAPAGWKGTWPPGTGSPWPYASFADYLDSLVAANYKFTEFDNVNISAYSFNYNGSITGNRTIGYTITLNGTTGNPTPPSPLPSNAQITLVLPPQDTSGGYDFAIYGVPQNCNTLLVAGFTCVEPTAYVPAQGGKPAIPANPGNVTVVTNSVYGWIQADVISALNFGYMNGKADAAFGGGNSSVWYGLPPVQFPFGQARPNPGNSFTDDGFYNAWAALMYNHSDAYGFAFSDRKGRPSPDIGFPIGGRLRVWILPDERLDAPMAAVTASTTTSISLQWPAVRNATSYTVTWSPPYQTASMQVPQPAGLPAMVTATVEGVSGTPSAIIAGTPYTITVRANGVNPTTGGAIHSFELPVYAQTQGTAAKPAAGNAQFQFGFNWAAPAFMTAGPATTWPSLQIAGQTANYSVTNSKFTVPLTTGITVGPPPASTALTVMPSGTSPLLYITESITPGSPITAGASTATMTVVLGNNTGSAVTLANGLTITLPPGVGATQVGHNQKDTTCPGVVTNPASTGTPSTVVMGAVQVPTTSCTIVVTLTSSTQGTVLINVPPMVVTGMEPSLPAVAPLVIPGNSTLITQSINPASINVGGVAALTITLGNTSGAPETLVDSFIMNLPSGVTVANPGAGNAGTCTDVILSSTTIAVATDTAIASGGCTIVVNVTSATAGTTTISTGTLLTSYPTTSFPFELTYGGNTIWAANVYLTMMGTPSLYSVGPCLPADHCIGSGLQNTVRFDTLHAPNFVERSGADLAIAGGAANAGPPFGGAIYYPTVGVSFTPVANKQYAPVSLPK